MKQASLILLFCVTVLLWVDCGPKQIAEEIPSECVPYNVIVKANDGNMIVSFKDTCSALESGYNIYISPKPLADDYPGYTLPASIAPHNNPIFPGDTNPDDGIEHYEAKRLKNGVPYFVSVRIVFPDRSLSKPSQEQVAVCGPRGKIDLAFRYSSDHDGFSFAQNEYVRANDLANDLYFFSKDGKDYLASPSRLNGFIRDNKFLILHHNGEFDDICDIISTEKAPSKRRVTISSGDWIQVLTTDGFTALVKVLSIEGSGDERHVRLFYAFSLRQQEPFF
ncbi:MAG: hypothetical protein U9N55_08090 [candidate division Zixibacteria bacterium]|nr:hypothetical protein [candidate division Zixibacteria bacterium]